MLFLRLTEQILRQFFACLLVHMCACLSLPSSVRWFACSLALSFFLIRLSRNFMIRHQYVMRNGESLMLDTEYLLISTGALLIGNHDWSLRMVNWSKIEAINWSPGCITYQLVIGHQSLVMVNYPELKKWVIKFDINWWWSWVMINHRERTKESQNLFHLRRQ